MGFTAGVLTGLFLGTILGLFLAAVVAVAREEGRW
jgi:tetrahydromethanopterin S-methyltransferase subunit B